VTFPWLIAMRKTRSGKLRHKSVPVQLAIRTVSCIFLAYAKSKRDSYEFSKISLVHTMAGGMLLYFIMCICACNHVMYCPDT
jgi:hypothetical protein